MQKILLHSPSTNDAYMMKSFLEKRLPYAIELAHSNKQMEEIIANRPIQLVIYDTAQFTGQEFQYLRDIRGLGYSYPFLILSNNQGSEALLAQAAKNKMHFLDKPYEFKALRGMTRKLMVQRSIQQQMHRRFRTQIQAKMETFIHGESFETQMFNLSKGGAYCEFSGASNVLGIGDLVRLRVNLEDLQRDYTLTARVVWTTRKGAYSGGHGAGLRFVKSGDIYRHLLEKV